jgi:hypothetical protein
VGKVTNIDLAQIGWHVRHELRLPRYGFWSVLITVFGNLASSSQPDAPKFNLVQFYPWLVRVYLAYVEKFSGRAV